jgi:hypothetical protein
LRKSVAAQAAFGHDFSRLPVHFIQRPFVLDTPLGVQSASPAAAKRETSGGEQSFSPLKGPPKAGTEDKSAAKGQGKKTVKKTEMGAPTAGECGAYSWKVKFNIENADESTSGYIVQKVDAKYNLTDCAGKDTPVRNLETFPIWEAWGVKRGRVFIGDTAVARSDDTYADPNMGLGSQGSIVVKGIAEFFPNVILPAHMTAENPKTQAGDLLSTTTDPALIGGTGAIPHDLTASWNCCPPRDTKTTFSNKK